MYKLEKYLPPRLSKEIKEFSGINEIKIKRNSRIVLKNRDENIILDIDISTAEFDKMVDNLIEHSYHSKLGELVEGYISIGDGYRVGIAGHAVTKNGTVTNISEIDSVCIRVPHLIRGLCEPIIKYINLTSYQCNLLIYSPPGVGKTTLLRDLAIRLSDIPICKRVALIDSRKEILLPIMNRYPMLDVYVGYPKSKAIEMAVRTLAPDYLICDEIGSAEDTDAILVGLHTGVSIIATAHGGDYKSMIQRPNIKKLYDADVFNCFVGIDRRKYENTYRFTFDEVS